MSSVFGNRHIVIALLVTPVLAVIAWFAVDGMVGETPHKAVAGQSYPLVERSNCRYDSGQCDLRNEDLHLSLTLERVGGVSTLLLVSNRSLQGVLLAVATGGETATPSPMRSAGSAGQRWTLVLDALPSSEQRLHIVVQAAGSRWFAEVNTAFLQRYLEPLRG